MGQISLFMGILVYMYTEPNSPHKLPHIHVVVGGEKAALSIPDGEVLAISANFPPKFAEVTVDHGTAAWPSGEDLCPDDLYANLNSNLKEEKGGVGAYSGASVS